jgi:hypothetical protein
VARGAVSRCALAQRRWPALMACLTREGYGWTPRKPCFKIPTQVVMEAFMRRSEGNAFMTFPIRVVFQTWI